jgi:predicted dehydrogenase
MERTPVRAGVVGAGYWGPNLIRNLAELPGSPLAAVCDKAPERLEYVRARYPSARLFESFEAMLGDDEVNAIVIATPAETHGPLARQALQAGKHVFVEKPLATSSAACVELGGLAAARGLTLMVGHTFVHNDALRWVKAKIDAGELGDVLYLYSRRLNLGQVRQDINVVWNLAPHDASIMLYLLSERPQRVACTGHCFLQPGVEDVAFLTMEFGAVAAATGPAGPSAARRAAHVHVSWLDPNKVREVVVVGSRKMVVYDDVDPERMIQVYDKGVDRVATQAVAPSGNGSSAESKDPRERVESFGEFKLLLRTGDLTIPKIRFTEPLRNELAHFVECVSSGKRPITDAVSGLEVVRVLEAADESLRSGGQPVTIEWDTVLDTVPASRATPTAS